MTSASGQDEVPLAAKECRTETHEQTVKNEQGEAFPPVTQKAELESGRRPELKGGGLESERQEGFTGQSSCPGSHLLSAEDECSMHEKELPEARERTTQN